MDLPPATTNPKLRNTRFHILPHIGLFLFPAALNVWYNKFGFHFCLLPFFNLGAKTPPKPTSARNMGYEHSPAMRAHYPLDSRTIYESFSAIIKFYITRVNYSGDFYCALRFGTFSTRALPANDK